MIASFAQETHIRVLINRDVHCFLSLIRYKNGVKVSQTHTVINFSYAYNNREIEGF